EHAQECHHAVDGVEASPKLTPKGDTAPVCRKTRQRKPNLAHGDAREHACILPDQRRAARATLDPVLDDDGPPLTLADVRAAAAVGRLPEVARQLVLEHSWLSLEVMLRHAGDRAISLEAFRDTVAMTFDAVAALPDPDRSAGLEDLSAARRQAASTL